MRVSLLSAVLGLSVSLSACQVAQVEQSSAQSFENSEVNAAMQGQNSVFGIREYPIISIAAFTAMGDEARLKDALVSGLEQGLTVNEIKAVLEHLYAYCGFPRSLTALTIFMNVVNERKAAGIEDVIGREPSKLSDNINWFEQGKKTQTEVVGVEVKGPIFEFSPKIDTYLKEHLFGAIFANDVLSYKDREIATVAALAALPAPAQLNAHYSISKNVGYSYDCLSAFAEYMEQHVGKEQGKVAKEVLEQNSK